jgi:hypothetical protein
MKYGIQTIQTILKELTFRVKSISELISTLPTRREYD